MVDVEAYHLLHSKGGDDQTDQGEPISEATIVRLERSEDFLVQLPPRIQGFNMTDKKWGE